MCDLYVAVQESLRQERFVLYNSYYIKLVKFEIDIKIHSPVGTFSISCVLEILTICVMDQVSYFSDLTYLLDLELLFR